MTDCTSVVTIQVTLTFTRTRAFGVFRVFSRVTLLYLILFGFLGLEGLRGGGSRPVGVSEDRRKGGGSLRKGRKGKRDLAEFSESRSPASLESALMFLSQLQSLIPSYSVFQL